MRSIAAANVLASDVALQFDKTQIKIKYLIDINISVHPAMDALIKIGNPSIPAVIYNLAESNDAEVRQLSLEVMYRVDGGKDVVKLRLQKAMKAETDPKKQTRLQSALDALDKTSF